MHIYKFGAPTLQRIVQMRNGNVVAIHDHDINDDVNMAQSGAHLVGEILPRSGGRTGSPSIVSWKATIYKKKTQKYQIRILTYQIPNTHHQIPNV